MFFSLFLTSLILVTFELHYAFIFFLLSGQWLTPLWQSPGPWCQILYVRWLLQGVHHPSDQQLRARATAGARAQFRGLWTDTPTARLQTPSGSEDDWWWWWWWWWCPQHWGTSQHFRVWVSVCVCEREKARMRTSPNMLLYQKVKSTVWFQFTGSTLSKLNDTLFNHVNWPRQHCFSHCRAVSS